MAEPTYLEVFGHEEIRARISRAVRAARLPQSLLFHGPRGTGKQRLAIWTAAVLQCTAADQPPCGRCRSCRLTARLEHPDVHWFFPMPRPKGASTPDKLESKLEDQRAVILDERRADPLYLEDQEGATGIYVAAVQTMRKLAHKTPAMGPRKVLIIGHAEAMTPQMGSAEAANALLKLLEEPPSDTTVILTSDVPGALLPTIRSRVQAVHVAPLATAQLVRFLTEHAHIPQAEAEKLAATAAGSIGRALELADVDREAVRESALDLTRALLDGRPPAWFAAAHSHRSFGARGAFDRVLKEARGLLRDLLAIAAEAPGSAVSVESANSLYQRFGPDPAQLLEAMAALDRAQELAERNVNPQLIVVSLLRAGSRHSPGAGNSKIGN